MTRRAHFTDEQILSALHSTAGVQAAAARLLEETHGRSCSRNHIGNRIVRSAKLSSGVREILERNIDLAEGKLLQAIQNGEGWAVLFMLKTRGKDRGWTEKLELSGTVTHRTAPDVDVDRVAAEELDAHIARLTSGED